VAITVLPFTARNYGVARDWILVNCTGGIHLYIGNHEGARGGYTPVRGIRPVPSGHFYDARRIAEKEIGHPLKPSEVSAYWKRRTWAFIRSSPITYLKLLGRKALLLLNAYEVPNNDNYQLLANHSPLLAALPGAGLLLPLGISGLLLSIGRPGRRLTPLLIFLGSQTVAVIAAFVTWRYRLPITLVLWPLAALFVVRMAEWIRLWRPIPLATGVVALLVSHWVTHLPVISSQEAAGRLRAAEARMATSAQESRLWQELAATPRGQRRLGHDPVLAIAQLRENHADFEGAAALLEHAVAEDPRRWRAWHQLAHLRGRLGDWKGAKKAASMAKGRLPASGK